MSAITKKWNQGHKNGENLDEGRFVHAIATSSAIDSSFGHDPLFVRKHQLPACIIGDKVEDWATNYIQYWDFNKQRWIIDNDLISELDNGETDLELLNEEEFKEKLQKAQSEYDQLNPLSTPVPEN